jgi:hypothetical protein
MEYTEVTNAVYADPDNKTISCLVQFDKFPNPLPFLAMKDDVEPHGNKIWNELKNGDHGTHPKPATSLYSRNRCGLGHHEQDGPDAECHVFGGRR